MTTYAFASTSLGIFFVTNAEVKDECIYAYEKQKKTTNETKQQRNKNNMFQTRRLTATEDYSCNKIVNCY